MELDYFDMLSGYPIFIPEVGHIRSPKLKDICPTVGTGHWNYTFYINVLSWNKNELLRYLKILGFRGEEKLHRDELCVFDIITLVKEVRELYAVVLGFFLVENIDWDPVNRVFNTSTGDDTETVQIGSITRDNFKMVCDLMLQMNFIGVGSSLSKPKYTSEKAKELWERAQKFLEAQTPVDKPQYHLNNIISKLCAAHPSYNFLNIFDLTIFQLYDAFFEYGYIRSQDLSEDIFSNHGGEHFNFEDWLRPIL